MVALSKLTGEFEKLIGHVAFQDLRGHHKQVLEAQNYHYKNNSKTCFRK